MLQRGNKTQPQAFPVVSPQPLMITALGLDPFLCSLQAAARMMARLLSFSVGTPLIAVCALLLQVLKAHFLTLLRKGFTRLVCLESRKTGSGASRSLHGNRLKSVERPISAYS